MYYKVLLKSGQSFVGYRGFWQKFWSGWLYTYYIVSDETFGRDCINKEICLSTWAIAGTIKIVKKVGI